jgi:hypothetical protein
MTMKNLLRFGGAAAFVIGAIIGSLMFATAGTVAGPVSLTLFLLSPGWPVAALVIGMFGVGILTPGSFSSFLVATALFNGAIYWLVWRLTVAGKRALRIPVILGLGIWISLFVYGIVTDWPKRRAPVDLKSPRVGVIHGERGDAAVTVILHPRIDGTLDGYQCTGPQYVERFDKGTYSGDSISYDIISFQQRGRRVGTTLMIESAVGRSRQLWELRFASADTGRTALPARVEGPTD